MSPRARVPTLAASRAGVQAQTRVLGEHRRALAAQLRAELDLPPTPAGRALLVVLMGYPGVGKTHCARLIAARLGAAHVATDHIRSRLFIAASYADEENATVFGAARELVGALLREGHTVVLDATHLRAAHREPVLEAAAEAGAGSVCVLVTAPDAETRSRLTSRSGARGDGDRSDADVAVYERMRARGFEPPERYAVLRNGPGLSNEVARLCAELAR